MKIRLPRGFVITSLMAATLVLILFAPAPATKELPDVTHDGLRLIRDSKLAVVYVKPDVDFNRYAKFLILKPGVAFRQVWVRRHREMRAMDIARIKTTLMREFMAVFTAEFAMRGGFPVVNQPAENVLTLKPAIIDLDVTVPGESSPAFVDRYSASAGAATLYLEIYDALSGEILARILDRKVAGGGTLWSLLTRNGSESEARRTLRRWARTLRAGLNEAWRQAPLEAATP